MPCPHIQKPWLSIKRGGVKSFQELTCIFQEIVDSTRRADEVDLDYIQEEEECPALMMFGCKKVMNRRETKYEALLYYKS